MLNDKKYIFWDFNGTILDDLDLCFNILNDMLIEVMRPTVTLEEYLEIFTFPIIEYYGKVFDLDKTPFAVLAKRFIEDYQPKSLNLKLHEHVLSTIKHFKEKKIKQVLLSASEKTRLIEQLKHYEIYDLFDDVLGTGDYYASSKLEVGKRYAQEHQIKPGEAIFIGDTLHDAEIATKLNMDCFLYTKGHQSRKRLSKYPLIDDFKALIR